jgi:hypothetical protein
MAYQKVDHPKIADLLDTAEYLAAMLHDPREMTATFRSNLAELATRHGCHDALAAFDGTDLPGSEASAR